MSAAVPGNQAANASIPHVGECLLRGNSPVPWLRSSLQAVIARITTPLPGLLLLACQISGAALGAEPPAESVRRYAQGPLAAEDFCGEPAARATVPEGDLRALAYTATELRYNCRYRTTRRGRTCTAYLTEFEAMAVMLREQSWNLRKRDRRLLDHEQGHFDLAQVWALRARAEMSAAIRKGDFREVRESERAASDALRESVERKMESYRRALVQAHRNYDQLTRYGTLAAEQARHRASHTRALREPDGNPQGADDELP